MQVLITAVGPDNVGLADPLIHYVTGEGANIASGFAELLDTRGKDDVASPLGEWTVVECVCRADRITVKINGITVNEAYAVVPASGKILLENEANEIFFRNIELNPLPQP